MHVYPPNMMEDSCHWFVILNADKNNVDSIHKHSLPLEWKLPLHVVREWDNFTLTILTLPTSHLALFITTLISILVTANNNYMGVYPMLVHFCTYFGEILTFYLGSSSM